MSSTPLLAALVAVSLVAPAQQERRARTLSYPAVPRSLAEMLKQVDLVVVGRIEAREQRALGTGADATPVINHTVRILDLVKGTAAPGRTITVVQPGGIVVTSGVEMYIDDPFYPVFKAGGEYVLFLWYDDHFKHLTPLYGSAAAFPVIDSKVSIPSRATRVEAFEGKRSFDLVPFVALLRRHVGSR